MQVRSDRMKVFVEDQSMLCAELERCCNPLLGIFFNQVQVFGGCEPRVGFGAFFEEWVIICTHL